MLAAPVIRSLVPAASSIEVVPWQGNGVGDGQDANRSTGGHRRAETHHEAAVDRAVPSRVWPLSSVSVPSERALASSVAPEATVMVGLLGIRQPRREPNVPALTSVLPL